MRATIALIALHAAFPAAAQVGQWTPAPVPGVAQTDAVAPADRAGQSSAVDHSSPFAATPSGSISSGQSTTGMSAQPTVRAPSVSR
jgi:hypothetical protein